MNILDLPRMSGKTTQLVIESAITGYPILCANNLSIGNIKYISKNLNLNIPEPFTIGQVVIGNLRGKRFDKILIDDIDYVIKTLLSFNLIHTDIYKATLTSDKFNKLNESEENNMNNEMNSKVMFDAYWLGIETYNYNTNAVITDIKIIVPNKVVRYKFRDGEEKLVCSHGDTFDFRKGCFIAIAKHLYKSKLTPDGIEKMAEFFTYSKHVCKIVDRAIKNYNKKEKDKIKKDEKEKEEKLIKERQREKKIKYKQRRRERRNNNKEIN